MNQRGAIDLTADTDTGRYRDDRADWKHGARVLGVAESFERDDGHSSVVGVVMRGDLHVDGMAFCRPSVGGRDATQQLLEMFERLGRQDIRAWILGGSIISWFNVVDIIALREGSGIPVVCVSYYESEGLLKYLKEYFPDDWMDRWRIVQRNGARLRVRLRNGYEIFVNMAGLSAGRAKNLLDLFTSDGRVPEPVRVARIVASAVRRDLGDAFR